MSLISMPGAVTREYQPDSAPDYAISSLLLPTWYADLLKRRGAETRKLAEQQRLKRDAGWLHENDKALKDTKPVAYADTTDRTRPIFIVGGRGMWREDMKEKVARLREKPNPALNPDIGAHDRNVKEDVSIAVDRRLRAMKGHKTFHIKNNPVGRDSV